MYFKICSSYLSSDALSKLILVRHYDAFFLLLKTLIKSKQTSYYTSHLLPSGD